MLVLSNTSGIKQMAMQHSASTSNNRNTVVGVFHSPSEAQQAIRELKAAGFTDSEIGVASHDKEGAYGEYSGTEGEGNKSGTGAAVGATAGLGAGALWGLGIVAGVLPAIGPVIAGGALAAIAASAAGTAVAGGVLGALVGLGIPEEEAEYYQGEFERGRTVVTVKATGDRYNKAHQILDRYNAYDYGRRESEYAKNPSASQRMNTEGKLVAREEVLHADKHMQKAGEARVRKEVTTETAHIDVPVKREELVVERTPMHGEATGPIRGGNEEERIVLKEEKADVNKRTVAREAVSVGKRTVTDTERVDADLKKENIVVDGDAKNRGPGSRPR
jgi:uncharacterized protein (TIGR02271 family)